MFLYFPSCFTTITSRNFGITESWNHGGFAKTTRQRVWRKPAFSLVVLQSAKHNTTPSFQNIPSILSLPSLPLYYIIYRCRQYPPRPQRKTQANKNINPICHPYFLTHPYPLYILYPSIQFYPSPSTNPSLLSLLSIPSMPSLPIAIHSSHTP